VVHVPGVLQMPQKVASTTDFASEHTSSMKQIFFRRSEESKASLLHGRFFLFVFAIIMIIFFWEAKAKKNDTDAGALRMCEPACMARNSVEHGVTYTAAFPCDIPNCLIDTWCVNVVKTTDFWAFFWERTYQPRDLA
jgi:hypothetical protein